MMKTLCLLAIILFAASCSAKSDIQQVVGNIVETGSDMTLDSLQSIADQQLQRHTGADSLAAGLRSVDTIQVEREVKRELIRLLSE